MTSSATSFDGKRVVVIGGATGIGFAIAQLAGELGASIVIGSSNAANVTKAAERLHGAAGHVVDLRDEGGVSGFFEKIGAFDHLAITAGDWSGSMMGSIRDVDFRRELTQDFH
jgi:NAD(P)-dependent dehydrogenase (short-subunit alcohol dehydrogenase family)